MGPFTPDMEFARRVLLRLAETGHEWTAAIRDLKQGDALTDNLTLVVLCRLHEEGPLRPVQLQEAADITSGGMSKVLDRLEEAGLVARLGTRPPENRRGVEVALTKNGSTALAAVLAAVAPRVKRLMTDLARIAGEVDAAYPIASPSEP